MCDVTVGTRTEKRFFMAWQATKDWASITVQYDFTAWLTLSAGNTIGLTTFILFIFGAASFILNKDAHELIVKPIERMTRATERLANTLFALSPEEAGKLEGHEAVFVEEVVAKMARFFDVKKHKITTIYTPGDIVWNIEVTKENRDDSSSGLGHRVSAHVLRR